YWEELRRGGVKCCEELRSEGFGSAAAGAAPVGVSRWNIDSCAAGRPWQPARGEARSRGYTSKAKMRMHIITTPGRSNGWETPIARPTPQANAPPALTSITFWGGLMEVLHKRGTVT